MQEFELVAPTDHLKTSFLVNYTERIKELQAARKVQKNKKNRVSLARLVSLAAAFYLAWTAYPQGLGYSLLFFTVCFGIFLKLVAVSADIQQQIKILDHLIFINEEELLIAAHQFHHRKNGAAHLPEQHPYAHDLDLFGRASLFQYIQRTSSEQGDALLAAWLLAPATPEAIMNRQGAIRELAEKTPFRQELQALGMLDPITFATEDKINSFLRIPPSAFTLGAWKYIRFAGPAMMCTLLVLHIYGTLAAPGFYLSVLIGLLFTGWISKQAMPFYLQLNRISAEMETLSVTLKHIEGTQFQHPHLRDLQQSMQSGNIPASGAVKQFRGILDKMDIRLNPLVFIPLNIFLFWDLQQLFALENWRQRYPTGVSTWLKVIAEMEALQSLSTLHVNHPEWAFPELVPEHGTFLSSQLAHPLIPAGKRVASSFSTEGTPHISLITGSNMAGKSTFLRSIGVNTVLAMAGAPVCAEQLTLSPMRIMSSMRIADNLEESTSTFYAELKKLKAIITEVRKKEKVFLLLDEILRGTNSHDRHTGSAALIHQLIREHAVAVIATHDLELAFMKDISPEQLRNYHFDVQVQGEELYFDYALKEGVCRSMNASVLMKKIGIEM